MSNVLYVHVSSFLWTLTPQIFINRGWCGQRDGPYGDQVYRHHHLCLRLPSLGDGHRDCGVVPNADPPQTRALWCPPCAETFQISSPQTGEIVTCVKLLWHLCNAYLFWIYFTNSVYLGNIVLRRVQLLWEVQCFSNESGASFLQLFSDVSWSHGVWASLWSWLGVPKREVCANWHNPFWSSCHLTLMMYWQWCIVT